MTPSVSDTADTYWPVTGASDLSNFPIAVVILLSTSPGAIPPKSLRVGKLARDTVITPLLWDTADTYWLLTAVSDLEGNDARVTVITPSVSDTADTYWPATAASDLSNFPIAVVILVSTSAGLIPPKSLRVGKLARDTVITPLLWDTADTYWPPTAVSDLEGNAVRDTVITPSVSDTADTYWPLTAVSALSKFPIAVEILVSTSVGVIPFKSSRVGICPSI